MKALVLTYDKRFEFSELVVKSYAKLAPAHKLEFIIPYNDTKPAYASEHKNIKWVKTDPSIKKTMAALLKGIPDEEFVYWCLDDIYPHKIIDLPLFYAMYEHIVAGDIKCDALRFFNHDTLNGPVTSTNTQIRDMVFFNTKFSVYGFWFHQFMKSKILKKCFLTNRIADHYTIEQIGNDRDVNPHLYEHNICVPQRYIAILGETTRAANFLTENCVKAFNEYKINYKKDKKIIESIFNNRPIRILDKKVIKLL